MRRNTVRWKEHEPLGILQTKLTLILLASGDLDNTRLEWMKSTTLELPYTFEFSSLPLSQICTNS
jgi:hypothetical protein